MKITNLYFLLLETYFFLHITVENQLICTYHKTIKLILYL